MSHFCFQPFYTWYSELITTVTNVTTSPPVLEDYSLCKELHHDLNDRGRCNNYDEEPFETCKVGVEGKIIFKTNILYFARLLPVWGWHPLLQISQGWFLVAVMCRDIWMEALLQQRLSRNSRNKLWHYLRRIDNVCFSCVNWTTIFTKPHIMRRFDDRFNLSMLQYILHWAIWTLRLWWTRLNL